MIALVAAATSCTTLPERVEHTDVSQKNEKLKAEYEWTIYKPHALPSVARCGDKICMSEDDFKQSEQDKITLVNLRDKDAEKYKKLISIQNKSIDSLTVEEMAKHREREARQYCEIAADKQNFVNMVKNIGYLAVCAGGIIWR